MQWHRSHRPHRSPLRLRWMHSGIGQPTSDYLRLDLIDCQSGRHVILPGLFQPIWKPIPTQALCSFVRWFQWIKSRLLSILQSSKRCRCALQLLNELLAIVDTIKQFLNILIGQQNTISTAQKKLMREQLYIDRVMRWRLIIEEFGPKLISTKSEHDSMPDTLSRLATATLSTTNTFAMLRQRNSHFFRLTKSEQKNLMSRKTPKKNSTVEQVLSTVLSPHSDQSQQADPIQ